MSKSGLIAIKRPFLDSEVKDIWTINNYNYSEPFIYQDSLEGFNMDLYVNAKFGESEKTADCFEHYYFAEIITSRFDELNNAMQDPEAPEDIKNTWEKEHMFIDADYTADVLNNINTILAFSGIGYFLEDIGATINSKKILIIADEKNFMLEIDNIKHSVRFLDYNTPNMKYMLMPLNIFTPGIINKDNTTEPANCEYIKIYFTSLLESITKKYNIKREVSKMLLQANNRTVFSNQIAFNKGSVPTSDIFKTTLTNENIDQNYYRYGYTIDEVNKTIDVNIISCLSGDTLIQISKDGETKPIKDIKIGDYVYTPNGMEKVVYSDSNLSRTAKSYYLFTFEDERELKIIKNHRFLNPKNSKFEHILDRQVGDYLIDNNQKLIKIVKIELIEEEIEHYTIFTENTNQYYANGFLSGNKISKLPFKWLRKIGLKYCKHYYGW